MSSDCVLLSGLPPIIDAGVETLILGSFPSPSSLASQQYYAHPQNQFWRLLGAVIEQPLVAMPYDDRLRCLLDHYVGVWDIYQHCRREGALDSAIQAAETNDFSMLGMYAPKLRRVCFNGKTSARLERVFNSLGYATAVLPSSSPAYTLSFERKLEMWKALWPHRAASH